MRLNRYTKVNLNDIFGYEITGADGYGVVNTYFSPGDLEDLISEAIEPKNRDEDTMIRMRTSIILQESKAIRYEWDRKTGLSNGDEIHLTWNVDDDILKDEYGIVFVHDDISVEVGGGKSC